eukprot:15539-Heterococcus_DN1.PRE.5
MVLQAQPLSLQCAVSTVATGILGWSQLAAFMWRHCDNQLVLQLRCAPTAVSECTLQQSSHVDAKHMCSLMSLSHCLTQLQRFHTAWAVPVVLAVTITYSMHTQQQCCLSTLQSR